MLEINTEKMGRILIKSIPKGEAPDWVKEKWLGLEIPCLYYDPFCQNAGGVISQKLERPEAIYAVLQVQALDALLHVSPDAVEWWHSIGRPRYEMDIFFFDAGCVEVIKQPPSKQEILGELN